MKKQKDTALVIAGKEVQNYELMNVPQMAQMADVLKAHIIKQKLFTNIQGKNYAHVDGWQFGGGLVGLLPKVTRVENMSNADEVKWFCAVDIVRVKSGEAVSSGFSICSSKEGKKKGSDEYVILSMAQTRAIGKAYRNILGWVMKLAGYESTPAEEVTKEVVQKEVKETVKKETVKDSGFCKACADEGAETALSKQVIDYTVKVYGKSLCLSHQKTEPRLQKDEVAGNTK